ncbi:hypothetical protein ACET3Z_004447 [Daucus carota]
MLACTTRNACIRPCTTLSIESTVLCFRLQGEPHDQTIAGIPVALKEIKTYTILRSEKPHEMAKRSYSDTDIFSKKKVISTRQLGKCINMFFVGIMSTHLYG